MHTFSPLSAHTPIRLNFGQTTITIRWNNRIQAQETSSQYKIENLCAFKFVLLLLFVGSFEFSTVFIWFAYYYKTFVFYASSFFFMMLSMAITMIFLYLMNFERETEKKIFSILCSRRNVFIWKASLNWTEIYFTTIIFGLFTVKQNLFLFHENFSESKNTHATETILTILMHFRKIKCL